MNEKKEFTKIITIAGKYETQEVPINAEDLAYIKAWETIKAYIKKMYKGKFLNGFQSREFKTKFYLGVAGHLKSVRIDEQGNAYIHDSEGYHVDRPRKAGVQKKCSEFNLSEDTRLFYDNLACIVEVVDNWRSIKEQIEDRAFQLKKVYEFTI